MKGEKGEGEIGLGGKVILGRRIKTKQGHKTKLLANKMEKLFSHLQSLWKVRKKETIIIKFSCGKVWEVDRKSKERGRG